MPWLDNCSISQSYPRTTVSKIVFVIICFYFTLLYLVISLFSISSFRPMTPWQAIQHDTDKKHTFSTYVNVNLKQNTKLTPSLKTRWLLKYDTIRQKLPPCNVVIDTVVYAVETLQFKAMHQTQYSSISVHGVFRHITIGETVRR